MEKDDEINEFMNDFGNIIGSMINIDEDKLT
jgi:hypothetical protein